MNIKIRVLFIFLVYLLPTSLFPQTDKIVVSVEKADIYSEPSTRSYRIETVNRGTVLALFQKAKVNKSWYYVRFQSRRYGGPAMGFIKDTEVEPFAGEQREPVQPPPIPLPETQPPPKTKEKAVPEKKPPELEEKKEEEVTVEKPPVKKQEAQPPPPLGEKPVPEKKAEPLEPVILTEEIPADTLVPAKSIFDPSLAMGTLLDRTWIVTRWDAADTPLPYPRSIQVSAPQDSLESGIWEVVKPVPEPVPEPPPPPKKEIAPPVEKLPAERPEAKEGPPAAWTEPPADPPAKEGGSMDVTEFSERISLSKSADSFEVRLNYAPYGAYRTFEIPNPNRMVIDFEDVAESAGFFRYRVNKLGIAFIRVAMFQDNIARVVLDFTEEIPAYQIEQIDTGINILFWLAEAAPAPKAEARAIPAPPPEQEAEPEPKTEPVATTEEALQETATPISSRFSLAEPMYPRLPRLFLWIEGDTVETVMPRASLANLPAYYPPTQVTFWEVVRSEPLKAQPRPGIQAQDIPPPPPELETIERKETEKKPPAAKDAKEEKPAAAVDEKKEALEKEKEVEQPQQITPPPQSPYDRSQVRLPARLTLGLGYGSSTGGLGGFVQYAVRPNIALHGGIGYYPTSMIYSDTDWVENQMLWSLGLKYYVPIVSQSVRAFLNVQYGGFTVEAVQVIEGIWDYEFIYRNEQRSLYGPQALLGGEFRLGPLSVNAAAGAAYALTEWEWLPQDLYFTFDLGLIFHLK